MQYIAVKNNSKSSKVFRTFFILDREIIVVNRQLLKKDKQIQQAIRNKILTVTTTTSRRVGGINLQDCRKVDEAVVDPGKALKIFLVSIKEIDEEVVEAPVVEKVVEEVVEAPVVEAPVVEAPVVEAPVVGETVVEENIAQKEADVKTKKEAAAKAQKEAAAKAKKEADAKTKKEAKVNTKSNKKESKKEETITGELTFVKLQKGVEGLGKKDLGAYVRKNLPEVKFNSQTSMKNIMLRCEKFLAANSSEKEQDAADLL